MQAPMVEYALLYADKGFAVFPLSPFSKLPIKGTSGFKDATKDPKTIKKMWKKFPDANIGIATGKISGVFVVDVDVKEGAEGDVALEALEKQYGKFPKTVCCLTPSGGVHYYFKYPEDAEIPCSQGQLGRGIDVRGDGGYVVAPPSVLDGEKFYDWEASGHFDEVEVADAP